MNNLFKSWYGNKEKYIDTVNIKEFHNITMGCFGGSSERGAYKNEDGYIVAKPTDNSAFVVLLDAHTTDSSAKYFINKLADKIDEIIKICRKSTEDAFPELQNFITNFIKSEELKNECEGLIGETALLICFQKEEFLWWLSIGDNSVYVFHREFNELGQYKVNQRIFYQWIGQKNSIGLKVPCYTSGTLELRAGVNKILLLTDGVLEIDGRPYEDNNKLKHVFRESSLDKSTGIVLEEVQRRKGADNATMLSWMTNCKHQPLTPTRIYQYE